jgi:hypothetical protein
MTEAIRPATRPVPSPAFKSDRKMLEVKVQILDVRGFRACLAGYVMNAFGFFWSLGPSQNPKKEEFSNNPMFVPKMCSKSKFKYLMLEDLEPAWLAM